MGKTQHIDFDNECWVCGKTETFNVCPDCGVDIYMSTTGQTDTNAILQYLKNKNPKRFNQMIKQSKKT